MTHVFYAAYQDRPTWAELVPPNLAMLVNVVDAVEPVARGLQHVSLMQGYKVYGAHLGPFKTPAREDDPPHMPPEFNVDQQQFLEQRQTGQGVDLVGDPPVRGRRFRPRQPDEPRRGIAVYASMSKELGVPLRFPGKPGAYDALLELTDAGLLAKATVWAATAPAAANQAFNITNGDLFRWNELWPKLAALVRPGGRAAVADALQDVMADKEPLWKAMSRRTGWRRPRTPTSRPGRSPISSSHGTTTSSPTPRSPAGPASTSTSTPKRCSRHLRRFRRRRIIP